MARVRVQKIVVEGRLTTAHAGGVQSIKSDHYGTYYDYLSSANDCAAGARKREIYCRDSHQMDYLLGMIVELTEMHPVARASVVGPLTLVALGDT
jgi:hypothetical protein